MREGERLACLDCYVLSIDTDAVVTHKQYLQKVIYMRFSVSTHEPAG